MININFSPNPCRKRNEKLLGLFIPAAILGIITILNISFFTYYRFKNADIHQLISDKESSITETSKKISAKTAIISKKNYKTFIKNYNFLNSLIRKKQLSWSGFFENMEKILPPNVKLIVISPTLKNNRIVLNITAEAISKDQQLKIIENLHESASFDSPSIESESIDPVTRNIKFSMKVIYTGKENG